MMSEFKLKKGLGRGLSSLIGESSSKKNTFKVNIKDIVRNKFQMCSVLLPGFRFISGASSKNVGSELPNTVWTALDVSISCP